MKNNIENITYQSFKNKLIFFFFKAHHAILKKAFNEVQLDFIINCAEKS